MAAAIVATSSSEREIGRAARRVKAGCQRRGRGVETACESVARADEGGWADDAGRVDG